ncbi:MAG TPA: hypothetical protein VH061_09355 [Solirubrobacteraceae bacterium]|jgi:hypothetical protein|nr:hypothetical protein [Solirubrobacteraceae bacterium]
MKPKTLLDVVCSRHCHRVWRHDSNDVRNRKAGWGMGRYSDRRPEGHPRRNQEGNKAGEGSAFRPRVRCRRGVMVEMVVTVEHRSLLVIHPNSPVLMWSLDTQSAEAGFASEMVRRH